MSCNFTGTGHCECGASGTANRQREFFNAYREALVTAALKDPGSFGFGIVDKLTPDQIRELALKTSDKMVAAVIKGGRVATVNYRTPRFAKACKVVGIGFNAPAIDKYLFA